MAHAEQMTSEMRECIQNCLECSSICVETAHHCLTMGGKHADPKHIGLLNNCAHIRQTSAAFMLSGSELHGRVCGVCAEVCRACEQSCSSMADGDGQCDAALKYAGGAPNRARKRRIPEEICCSNLISRPCLHLVVDSTALDPEPESLFARTPAGRLYDQWRGMIV
jgi:hypothetical protein